MKKEFIKHVIQSENLCIPEIREFFLEELKSKGKYIGNAYEFIRFDDQIEILDLYNNERLCIKVDKFENILRNFCKKKKPW